MAGAWADCSTDLHSLDQKCAKSQVAHLCKSAVWPGLKGQLSVIAKGVCATDGVPLALGDRF